jgi:hypothetical protein
MASALAMVPATNQGVQISDVFLCVAVFMISIHSYKTVEHLFFN